MKRGAGLSGLSLSTEKPLIKINGNHWSFFMASRSPVERQNSKL